LSLEREISRGKEKQRKRRLSVIRKSCPARPLPMRPVVGQKNCSKKKGRKIILRRKGRRGSRPGVNLGIVAHLPELRDKASSRIQPDEKELGKREST